ncbi:hypothetical protein [Streptomyces sp. NBC_01216]|uniref:hypothetical protein n=1 Tax=unclassified Streptomyces TaxID=2593676 RepID=UPI002E13423B|nr:hypothetical protein OG393_04370 [Streptomyces sp. NBC_01216]
MRAIRVATAALLTSVALSLAMPAAVADDATANLPTRDGLPADDVPANDATPVGDVPGNVGAEGDGAAGAGPGLPGYVDSGAPGSDGTGKGVTSFGYSVTPATVAPGGTVALKSDGCEVPSVTVSSGVFDTITLVEGRQGTATVDVEARVDAQYEVTFDCKGERGTAMLTVARGKDGHSTSGTGTGAGDSGGTVARRGVKAGFGGDTGGLGTAEVVAGSALVAGALGGGVLLAARRRRGTGRG